jgi:hypothetical protein
MDSVEVLYFAIGSMMNPISMKARGICPKYSKPGEILDHEFRFFGPQGMAEAIPCQGKSFHGVLHCITQADVDELNKIEVTYDFSPCSVKLYDGQILSNCYVYVLNAEKRGMIACMTSYPPSERYLEILIEGCRYYGVAESYIDFLSQHPKIPRKLPSEYRSLDIPAGLSCWTMEQVAEGIGVDGKPLYMALNGKVIEYVGKAADFFLSKIYLETAGKHLEIAVSMRAYEPKYGFFERIEDFTREHARFIEEMHIQLIVGHEHLFRVVALIDQPYKD